MKKTLQALIITSMAILNAACGQTVSKQTISYDIPEGWILYDFPQVCSFAVPQSMELRQDNSEYSHQLQKLMNTQTYRFLCDECDIFEGHAQMKFQPIGLDNDPSISDTQYARILVTFTDLSEQELSENIFRNATKEEMKEFGDQQKDALIEQAKCSQNFLPNISGEVKWNDIKREEINGVFCLVYDYERPGNIAATKVQSYQFICGTRMIEFTLSYNKRNANLYAEDFKKFLATVKISSVMKDGKAPSSSITSRRMESFKSADHNIKFSWNPSLFQKADIRSAPHMILKLNGIQDNMNAITISAFSDMDLTGYTFDEKDLLAYCESLDNNASQNSGQFKTTIVSSCVKTNVNGYEALRSELSTDLGDSRSYNVIIYRFINKGEMQTVDLFMLSDFIDEHPSIEHDIINNFFYLN